MPYLDEDLSRRKLGICKDVGVNLPKEVNHVGFYVDMGDKLLHKYDRNDTQHRIDCLKIVLSE